MILTRARVRAETEALEYFRQELIILTRARVRAETKLVLPETAGGLILTRARVRAETGVDVLGQPHGIILTRARVRAETLLHSPTCRVVAYSNPRSRASGDADGSKAIITDYKF